MYNSINYVIIIGDWIWKKSHVGYKSHQLIEFVEYLKSAIDEQNCEVERAIIGRGKYRFDDTCKYTPESKWFKMTEKQRQDHIFKVCGTKITKTGIGTGAVGSSSSSSNSVV